MPRRDFNIPFAVSGDTASVPTNIQSDGSVSLIQGYGFDYERPTDGTDPLAKVFPRDVHNGLLNEITASLGEIQLNGRAIWSAGMAPYPVNAEVRHADLTWRNTIANNSSAPDANNSGWIATGSKGQIRYAAAGSFSFTVPAGVTAIYVDAAAGGGGGGGGATFSSSLGGGGGGGGGAGQSIVRARYAVTPGQVIAGTVGAGGAGGTQSSGDGAIGTAGGNTVIGSLITLNGGGAGRGGIRAGGGAGGIGGAPGGSDGGDSRGYAGDGGSGGSGPFGTAGGGGRAGGGTGKAGSGSAPYGYGVGGGGGGGTYASGTIGANGTAGMPGIVIIEW